MTGIPGPHAAQTKPLDRRSGLGSNSLNLCHFGIPAFHAASQNEARTLSQDLSDPASSRNKPPFHASLGTMINRPIDQEAFARALRLEYGRRAGQFVVDRILESIRNADLEAAKWWDQVGSFLDEQDKNGPT